jgi:hypothetical protein
MIALLLGTPAMPIAAAPSPETRPFQIVAGSFDMAMVRFSEQAGVQIIFDPKVAQGETANAVKGRFTVAEALNRLLACTGLGWRFLSARTITIEMINPESSKRRAQRRCRA